MIVATRMYGREIGRKRRHVMVILLGIIGKRLFGELTTGPGKIERMFEQVLLCDVKVEGFEISSHKEVMVGQRVYRRRYLCPNI